MRDIKDFQARYDRWKNGERYWDIRGVDLPLYDDADKNTNIETPLYYYNVFPSAIGAKNLEVTTPDVVITPNYTKDEKTLDQKAQEEREFLASHPFLANIIKNTKEISKGWDNFWENNLFRYPAMVATGGLLGKTILQLGRMKKAADLIKLRKDTAHLGPGHYRDIAREIGPDIHDQLINDALDIYGEFQQTPIGALLPFDNGKEGNVMKKKNDFYTWLDLIANEKAQEWTKAPMKPLSTDEVYADMLNDPTYNYKAFYEGRPYMANAMLYAPSFAHFDDFAKTMYHPTFSNLSIYSGKVSDYNPLGIIGGSWNEEGTEYTPSMSLLANYWNYNRTRDYLDHAEDHPVKINLPQYGGGKIGSFVHRMGPLIYQGLTARGVKNIDAAYANLMRLIAHESGYGTSGISRQHNYGGIKMPGSNNYRKFNSDRDFADYYLNLMTSRYRNAIDAKDLNGFVNALGNRGYFLGLKAEEYFKKLNTLKSFDRAVAQDFAARHDFYNQTTGVQPNPETNEPEFVQPIPKEQQPIEVPYLDPLKLGTLTIPVNPPAMNMLTLLPQLKPELYPNLKPDGSFDHGKSGIHINPANRGKFNATKKRTGKTTEELSHSKNPLTRKRALFALNARKWKH